MLAAGASVWAAARDRDTYREDLEALIDALLSDTCVVFTDAATGVGEETQGGTASPIEEPKMSETSTASVPRRRGDELLSGLAERIGGRLGAATVFGAPVERDGVTVVPVAVARFAIGAGAGTDPSKGQEGEGGGGAGAVTPIGYIELKGGRSRFVPVVHPARMLVLVLAAVIAGLLIIRSPRIQPRPRKLPWN